MAHRAFAVVLVVMFAAAWASAAIGDIFLHQPHDFRDRSPSEQNTSVPNARTADDVTTNIDHFFVNFITFEMIVTINDLPVGYAVDFYSDREGQARGPDVFLGTLDRVEMLIDRGPWNGNADLHLFEVTIRGSGFHLPENTYWLSAYAIGNGAGRAWWGTAGDGVVNGSEGYFISDHFGVPQWTPISQSGILNFPTDFAFVIDATFPTPGALPLLAAGLLGASRRRRA